MFDVTASNISSRVKSSFQGSKQSYSSHQVHSSFLIIVYKLQAQELKSIYTSKEQVY